MKKKANLGSLGIGVVKTFWYTDFTENMEKARIFLGFLRENPCNPRNPCTNHGESQEPKLIIKNS